MRTHHESSWTLKTAFLFSCTAALISAGCARDPSQAHSLIASIGNESSPALLVESAVSSVNNALNDAEQVSSYAQHRLTPMQKFSDFLIPSAWAASCGVSRFSPLFGSASCRGTANNATVTATFNGCTAGQSGEFALSGSEQLTFDSATTCDTWISGNIPTSGSVTRTSTDFTQRNSDGSKVFLTSADHTNYLGTSISGGTRTAFSSNGRSVTILGLHRIHVYPGNVKGYDHSIYTLDSILATGLKANGSRRIESGTVRVDNNANKFSSTMSLAGLAWSTQCCHPVSGTINFTVNATDPTSHKAVSSDFTATFNAGKCGQISLGNATTGAITTLQLAACD